MSKELECLDRIDKRNYLTEREHKEFLGVVESALTEYEAIKNAEPSEALKQLNILENNLLYLNDRNYDQDGIINNISASINAIKQALLKAQEPKQYLKWENLEFNIDKQMMTVLLNGTKYTLIVGCNVHFDKLAFLRNGEINYYFLEDDKQFFNDLRLERVEE